MGNAAAKELEAKVIGKTTLDGVDEKFLKYRATEKTMLVCKTGMKGAQYFKKTDGDDELILTGKMLSHFKNVSAMYKPDSEVAMNFHRVKSGFNKDTHYTFFTEPAFEGQEPDPDGKLKDDEPDRYLVFKIEVERQLTTAEAVMSVVQGYEDGKKEYTFKPIAKSHKLSAAKLLGWVEDMAGTVVTRCRTAGGLSMALEVEVGEGMDIPMALGLCSALNAGGNPVGALAGAGVV